jgi:hypothetical protein
VLQNTKERQQNAFSTGNGHNDDLNSSSFSSLVSLAALLLFQDTETRAGEAPA